MKQYRILPLLLLLLCLGFNSQAQEITLTFNHLHILDADNAVEECKFIDNTIVLNYGDNGDVIILAASGARHYYVRDHEAETVNDINSSGVEYVAFSAYDTDGDEFWFIVTETREVMVMAPGDDRKIHFLNREPK